MRLSLDALVPSHGSRDPRFAELDRLIAEEEMYRPKGSPLAEFSAQYIANRAGTEVDESASHVKCSARNQRRT
jgi:hypothetical protein